MPNTNGLLITIKGKQVISQAIHEDYTIDDVHICLANGTRGDKPTYTLEVWIGVVEGEADVIIEVEPLLTRDDLCVQIYTCEKHVLGQKYGHDA